MTIKEFSSAHSAAGWLYDFFLHQANYQINKKGFFAVAIPGGNSALPFFRLLADTGNNFSGWEKVHFFWTDERWVPHDHAESNYKNAIDCGLPSLSAHFHPYCTQTDPEAECRRYHDMLATINVPYGNLDLANVGMGPDGHIASVFPGSRVPSGLGWIMHTVNPHTGQMRIGMTVNYLGRAEQVVLFVMGHAKVNTLKAAIDRKPPVLPVQELIRQSENLTIITDFHVG